MNIILKLSNFALIIILFFSCNNLNEPSIDNKISIVFPSTKSNFLTNQEITLTGNKYGYWKSDIDGFLGEGETINVYLTEGNHIITFFTNNEKIHLELVITYSSNTTKKQHFKLYGKEFCYKNDSEYFKPGLYSLSMNIVDISLTDKKIEKITKQQVHTKIDSEIKLKLPLSLKKISNSKFSRNLGINSSIKQFNIIDFDKGNSSQGITIDAKLIISTTNIDIWIDKNSSIDQGNIDKLNSNIDTILNEHQTYWGKYRDIDKNNKITVLITSLINETESITGYFNPADFFEYNNDYKSTNYNPVSNEMDILYIGCPIKDSNKYNYDTIIATIIHEFTHLKNFSILYTEQENKPLLEIDNNKLFIEEGLAHLAETLSGYGITGGNYAFVSKYFESSNTVSLNEVDNYISSDSIERRGGMVLLLSWLFWKQGGVTFSGNLINDNGGISWLMKMQSSYKKGWDKIEETTNSSRTKIFNDFFTDILDSSFWKNKYHLTRDEPININPYYGLSKFNNEVFNMNGLLQINSSNLKVYPYSIMYLDKSLFNNSNELFINTKQDLNLINLVIFNP